jgi:Gas vesicle synthesis protein GvpO
VTVESRRPAERERERERERVQPEERARAGARREPAGENVARLATGYVEEMTGKEPEGVVLLERRDEGGWTVGVEVVETRRIPDSTDILAVYEAQLDEEGELVAYRRVKRYSRCQVGER